MSHDGAGYGASTDHNGFLLKQRRMMVVGTFRFYVSDRSELAPKHTCLNSQNFGSHRFYFASLLQVT
jgi:hypothetical protein